MQAFILAGGKSSRMGRDKALLDLDGQPLIAHAVARLNALGMPPRICGSRPDLARFAEVISDNLSDAGPLAGIEAALTVSDEDLNLFLPVDLPGLPLEFLRWLAARANASQVAATFPTLAGRPQPLCAVYSRRLLPGLRAALAAGDRKVTVAISAAAASLGAPVNSFAIEPLAPKLIPHTWPAEPPLEAWFRNINTPDDYELLRTRAPK
ncbi:MAG TPA: molybdenum cofactor guanylyltransferase [Acidobacteriaceae bacterium]|nr:molybdenum cofactor guanylyltransferase [Acidobacteriaceae bacterium]